MLDRVERDISSAGRPDATKLAHDEKPQPPQPHRKTQVIARPEAIAALLRQPGWDDMLADAMRVQSRQTTSFADQLGDTHPALDTAATRRADQMMRGYEASIPEAERKRVSFYFAEGSHNMDDRGLHVGRRGDVDRVGPAGIRRSRGPLLHDGAHDVDRSAGGAGAAAATRASIIHRFARWIRATL